MNSDILASVKEPFTTTRTTRKVGLGIPLVVQNAHQTGGSVDILSEPGKGTVLTATFDTRSIDCIPLGEVSETIISVIMANPLTPELTVVCTSKEGEFTFSTAETREALSGVSLAEPEVILWLREYIGQEIRPVLGRIVL